MLVEVFEGILRFHKRAMGFFRRSGSSPVPQEQAMFQIDGGVLGVFEGTLS